LCGARHKLVGLFLAQIEWIVPGTKGVDCARNKMSRLCQAQKGVDCTRHKPSKLYLVQKVYIVPGTGNKVPEIET
jgi:hypothetical protein